jgi:molybdopterin-guanine dinucleotide biosynthesis protein A
VPTADDRAAGIVLVGGRSSRMGESKAALDWHGSTLLHHTASLLARTLDGPIVVVGAPGQDLPALPPGVELRADPVEGQGPVQGIAVGLAAVEGRAALAFVCSVDMPFLHPAFVRRVLAGLEDPDVDSPVDIALPFARGYRQPLAAAYRTSLAAPIAIWLAEGVRRPGQVFERCRVRTLDEAWLLADPDLAHLDPALESVTNVNDPDDYAEALRRSQPGADRASPPERAH